MLGLEILLEVSKYLFGGGQSSMSLWFNFRGCVRSCLLYTVQLYIFRGSNICRWLAKWRKLDPTKTSHYTVCPAWLYGHKREIFNCVFSQASVVPYICCSNLAPCIFTLLVFSTCMVQRYPKIAMNRLQSQRRRERDGAHHQSYTV
jgi:hypothetical protein